MRRALRLLLASVVLVVASSAGASTLRTFDVAGWKAIQAENAGKPYVVSLWSIHCVPCIQEMPVWKAMTTRYPGVKVVLVSTDPPDQTPRVEAFLKRYDPGRVDRWRYGDEPDERIRYAIDPKWRGELPRMYLYGADGKREAHTGLMEPAKLESWFREASTARR